MVGWGDKHNARVVACCDVDAKRLADAKGLVEAFYKERGESAVKVDTYGDYREVLARDDIDGVIVSTPEN